MKQRKKPGQRGVGYAEFDNPAGEMFDLGGGDEDRVRGEWRGLARRPCRLGDK